MANQINKKLKEEIFEEHFCSKLKGYRQRNNDNVNKDLHIDFDLLEEFLDKTQKDTLNDLKETYPTEWKNKLQDTIKQELEHKELIQIIQDGITVETLYEFKLIFTKNTTSFNKEQEQLVKSNIFSYVRQYNFDINTSQSIDIVFFLNGLVITTIEVKYIPKGQTVHNATEQYIKRDLSQSIFNLPFLHIASDNDEVKIATKFYTKTVDDFMPFNKDITNPTSKNDEYKVEYLYNDVLTKDSILHLIRNFVFVDKDSKVIFPRYHQRRAVQRLVTDISKQYEKHQTLNQKFLIEHSAGSGKSKTITWTAEQLKNLHINDEKVFNSVFIITDRRDLHGQISEDFEKMTNGSETICYVNSSEDLAKAIKNEEKVIVVILHNFSYIDKKDLETQKKMRICYLIDEYHRSQDGKLHSSMTDFFEKFSGDDDKLNFPNSVFIGFTATPSDKTLEKLGTKQGKDFVAYDTYSMEQAIKEGYILDVSQNIIPYQTLFKLRKDSEDKIFQKEFNALQVYKQLKSKAFEDKRIIEKKSRIILHYFKDKIEQEINGRGKAIIVTSSVLSAITYKIILDGLIKDKGYNYKTLVAFSGTRTFNKSDKSNEKDNVLNYDMIKDYLQDEKYDTETKINLSESILNKTTKIPKTFKKDDNIKFLIVAEKYQTGFDEPLLYGMFLDKSIKGINAVQTISRLNRTCPYKTGLPITVDFSNSFENIANAFGKYLIRTSSDRVTDYNELIALYQNIVSKGIIDVNTLNEFAQISELDKSIFQTKFEIFMNKIKDSYKKKDKVTKNEFRKNLGKFDNSFNYISTIINIKDTNIKLLGLIAKQLYINLNENAGTGQEIKKALEEIVIKKHRIIPVEITNNNGSKGRGKGKGGEREISKITIQEILDLLGEAFDNFVFSKKSKELFEEYLKTIVSDDKIRKKILNTPINEEDQNKKIILGELQSKLEEYIIMNPETYKKFDELKKSNILESVNNYAYELIRQDFS